jgi:hypothetical protein
MKDSADPIDGWDLREVLKVCGPASNDIYGKLYCLLSSLFSRFYQRLSMLEIHLELLNIDAQSLPDHLRGRTFSRIEVHSHPFKAYTGQG